MRPPSCGSGTTTSCTYALRPETNPADTSTQRSAPHTPSRRDATRASSSASAHAASGQTPPGASCNHRRFRPRAAGSTTMVAPLVPGVGHRTFSGVTTNLSNPKIISSFAAFLAQFVDPERGPVLPRFLTPGPAVQATGLAVDGTIGVAAGTVGGVLVRRTGVYSLLNRVTATVLAAQERSHCWPRYSSCEPRIVALRYP